MKSDATFYWSVDTAKNGAAVCESFVISVVAPCLGVHRYIE